MLPRVVVEQMNSSVLDLGNYSTTIIHIPSNDTTLVLKVQFSVSFKTECMLTFTIRAGEVLFKSVLCSVVHAR